MGFKRGSEEEIPQKKDLKIPHMGWYSLHFAHNGKHFRESKSAPKVYFVAPYTWKHKKSPIVKASASENGYISMLPRKKKMYNACQFHPIKL